ncbi:GAF domain-containing protein [Mycolicibacterium vaccae]|uniref:GAF domain-containing protein n=1 Tax=Mycolicibacterium vaccae ATCC 25954 TaxID=1194972 RepID=K0UX40_MYCVA|nr:GAF domain-containing protein [Mycolicibacterium vaccae]ANI38657.1 histidine kinase [Mycolicibacterium vaccae 95051]EJZ11346.1 GAF domain-containing protein [Mycolicibacterium vaccae ATCC 25954]MCV7063476.1 GAF domain-containing protein [Mycolicibacterium vaccae]
MTAPLPRFDDWLNRRLDECAREAGQDVDAYVARAVASQMVRDLTRRENPVAAEVTGHLPGTVTAIDRAAAVLTDPRRLRAVHATGLLDSPADPVYDRITSAAAHALGAPFAALAVVDADRQYFKSFTGPRDDLAQRRLTALDRSFSKCVVATGAPLAVEDARNHPVFRGHPAVRDGSVGAYLGNPLVDPDGNAIGALCVFDTQPRRWGAGHRQILGDLTALAAELVFAADTA